MSKTPPPSHPKLEPVDRRVLLWVKTLLILGITALMLATLVWAVQSGSALHMALSGVGFGLSLWLLHRSRHTLRQAVGLGLGEQAE